MSLPFSNFNVFPSCRTPTLTNYLKNLHPYEPCLGCSNPYHSSNDCPHWGQLSNFSYGQINTNFFSARGLNHILIHTPLTGITILISRGILMPWETMLSNLMNCTILNIRSSIPILPCLHHIIILLKSH